MLYGIYFCLDTILDIHNYELPIALGASSREKKVPPWYNNS